MLFVLGCLEKCADPIVFPFASYFPAVAGGYSIFFGLDEWSLIIIRHAGVLPLRLVVVMVAAVVTGVASPSAGACFLRFWAMEPSGMSAASGCALCSIGVCQSKMSFSALVEKCISSVLPACADGSAGGMGWVAAERLAGCLASIRCSWFHSWRIWNGTASSEWAGGEDGGGDGAASSEWAGGGDDAEPKEASACSEAGEVGMAIWMGTTSGTSIFRIYSFLVQPVFSRVYLSTGCVAPSWYGQQWHEIALDKCVPQFCLGLEVWAADGFGIFALNIPLGALLAQLILNCVKIFILKDVDKLIDAGAVVGQISSGWLSSKAKPAEVEQPLVDYVLQAVIFQAVVKEKPLFFPSVFGSNYFVMAFSNCCTAKSGRHAFGG
ncbi:hypothetical protein V6N11_064872 [Hibiscus sabdariffa]|uniref:Uncharacterized protein n=1 Tax=Hibiscus sabdariffa TaxID=183260 RepID=A0ABR2SIB6_9ROSI